MNKLEGFSFEESDKQNSPIEEEIKKAGIKLEDPRFFNIPEIDTGVFGEDSDAVAIKIEKIKKWLELPYLLDEFGSNHEKREEWWDNLTDKFGEDALHAQKELENNKMRDNKIAHIGIIIYSLVAYFRSNKYTKELAGEISERWKEKPDTGRPEFRLLSSENRKKEIEEIEDAVVDILENISEFTSKTSINE